MISFIRLADVLTVELWSVVATSHNKSLKRVREFQPTNVLKRIAPIIL